MFTATRIRLYPNASQANALERQFGCARWTWNNALEETQRLYKETGKGLGYESMSGRLPGLKREHEWLKKANAQVLQQSLRNLSKSFVNFFERRAGYPKFKAKAGKQSVQFPQCVKINGKRVFLPKIGWFKAVIHRPIVGEIKSVTVFKEPCGHYYASVFTNDGKQTPTASFDGPVLGVDVGLIDFAVTSDGSHFENPKHLKKAEKNLKRKQQSLSRKVMGSKSRDKARKLAARVHERVKNSRSDFIHKVSTRLVNENQVISVEDLNVTGMLRNRHLSKAISDVGWGMLTRFLEYKTARAGKGLIKVNRFYPSSKACNTCGRVRGKLNLSARFWTCEHCGAQHDRDENAARNIRDEAQRMIGAGITPASAPGTGAAAAGGNVRRGRGRKSSVTQIPVKAETFAPVRR